MQCIIYSTPADEQQMNTTWHGERLTPPFFFSFQIEGDELVYRVRRDAAASIHPQASPGEFKEELWRYDVVEFFIATPDAKRYLEFNLCPNGAWWAAGFTDPRVALEGFDAAELGVRTRAEFYPERWQAEARLSLAALAKWGWSLSACRMAATAVLCRAGTYTYLTTCEQRSGKPDFHHPWDWEAPRLV